MRVTALVVANMVRQQPLDVATVPLHKQVVPVAGGRHKSVFSGVIQVGARNESFAVVFDTGSGHLVLPGKACASPACVKHRQYGPVAPTGRSIMHDGSDVVGPEQDELTVNFGTGEVVGVFAEDRVCVGTACVTAHLIVATAMTDDPFLEFEFDGILGLGLGGLSQTPLFNLGERLGRIFAVFLSPRDTGSEISFGGWNPGLLAAPLAWSDVVDKEEGYWKLAVDRVTVAGVELAACKGGCSAIADSGTSVLAAPTEAVNWMRARLAPMLVRSGGLCSAGGATIVLALAGATLALDADDFAEPKGDGACRLRLMKLDVPPPLGPLLVLGEPVLTKYYTVFDAGAARVGFGLAKHHEAELVL